MPQWEQRNKGTKDEDNDSTVVARAMAYPLTSYVAPATIDHCLDTIVRSTHRLPGNDQPEYTSTRFYKAIRNPY
jgi:hypothetical protein